MRYWVAVVLLVLGLVGMAFGYPLRATPTPVEISFPGSYTDSGVVEVPGPGPYTVWEAGGTRHDGNSCRIRTADGAAVPVTATRPAIRWETDGDAVDTYTAIGSFDAPRAGAYEIRCTVDPATPGTSFAVTEKPGVAGSIAALVAGVLCVFAAAALAVLVRRRRRA